MNGKDVKKIREMLGLKQEEFSVEVGVSVQTVQKWEQERRRPSRLATKRLCDLAAKAANP